MNGKPSPVGTGTGASGLALTPNDIQGLRLLSLRGYRYLTCQQLARLLREAPDQRCQRLAVFARKRLVKELRIPVTTSRAAEEPVYTLAKLGAVVLAEQDDAEISRLYSRGGNSYVFLRHALAITDFRLSLEEALVRSSLRLLFWRSEWQLRALHVALRFRDRSRRRVLPLIPDAFFGITTPRKPRYFFLEVDRGSSDTRAVAKKVLAYVEFFRSGMYRAVFGIPYFRVLMVTTSKARMHGLLTFTKDLGRCPNMFLYVAVGRGRRAGIPPERMVDRIWRKCNDDRLHSLLE